MNYFKEPKKYSDLSFVENLYYAIICPLYIAITFWVSILGIINLFIQFDTLTCFWSLISSFAFFIFFRNIDQIGEMYNG